MRTEHVVITLSMLAIVVPILNFSCFGSTWEEFSNSRRVSGLCATDLGLFAGTNGGLLFWPGDSLECAAFGTLDGLPSRSVSSVCSGPAGQIAIATDLGVLLYGADGPSYLSSSNGLADDVVFDVTFGSDGRVLAATLGGLSIIDGPVGRVVDTSDGLPSNKLLCVLEDMDGGIWVGTAGFGAVKIIADRMLRLTTKDGLCGDYVYDITQEFSRRVVFATDGGVSVFESGVVSCIAPPAEVDGSFPIYSLASGIGEVLCGGPSGLFILEGDVLSRAQSGSWSVTEPVQAVAVSWDGSWRVAFEAESPNDTGLVYRMTPTDHEPLTAPSCPIEGVVSSIMVSGGLLFVGYSGFDGGISVLGGDLWQNFNSQNSPIAYDGVSAVSSWGDTLWVGTPYDGLWAQDQGGLRHLTKADGLASDLISSVAGAESGLWVGHSPIWDGYWRRGGGASFFDGQVWQSFGFGTPLEARSANAICPLGDGDVVFGTGHPLTAGAVVIRRGQEWETLSDVDGAELSSIQCGVVDDFGRVLLGTETQGLLVLEAGEWSFTSMADGLPSNNVIAIASSASGLVIASCDDWFDLEGETMRPGGLCTINDLEVWAPPRDAVPIDGPVTAIYMDDLTGEFWFGTRSGAVFRYSAE